MNTHRAIAISKNIVGLNPVTIRNIIHFQDENEEELSMAEKWTACEYVTHYLGMGIDPSAIIKTKYSRNNSLYIQMEDRDMAVEILKRGGLARKKNPELKITNFVPPNCLIVIWLL